MNNGHPNFPTVEVMEAERSVLIVLHIDQDRVCSSVATPVALVKDKAIQVGSLSVTCVVGRAS